MLKLQSWVDGELPEAEARQVGDLVRTDNEAAALADELKMTSGFLAGNEPEVKLAESREFYWSRIERAIERAEVGAEGRDALPWLVALRRFLVPVSGVALVLFLTVASIGVFNRNPGGGGTATNAESFSPLIEETKLSQHIDTFSFKPKSENMFVVYIVSKDEAEDDDQDSDTEFDEEMDDTVIQ